MWPFRHNSLFSSKKKSCNPHTPFSFVAHNTIPGRKKGQEISPELLQKNYKQTWYFLSFIQGQCSFSVTPVSSLTQSHTPTPGGCPICHFSGGGGGVSTTAAGTALAWGSCERYSFTFLSKCAERQSHENKMLAGNVSANTFMSGLY